MKLIRIVLATLILAAFTVACSKPAEADKTKTDKAPVAAPAKKPAADKE